MPSHEQLEYFDDGYPEQNTGTFGVAWISTNYMDNDLLQKNFNPYVVE